MLRPGDLAHSGADELLDLLVVLVLEDELHDFGLEAGHVQRDGKVVIGRDALQGRQYDDCRAPQESGLDRRERTILGEPNAQDADEPSPLYSSGGVEDLYLLRKAGHGVFRIDVLAQPGYLAFAERDDGIGTETHVEDAYGLRVDDHVL